MENQMNYGHPAKPYPFFDEAVNAFPLWKERLKTILMKHGFKLPFKSEFGLDIVMSESCGMLNPIRYRVYCYTNEWTEISIRISGLGDTVDAAILRFELDAIQKYQEITMECSQEGGNNE